MIKTFDDIKYHFENYNFNINKNYINNVYVITFYNGTEITILRSKIKGTNIRLNKNIKNYIFSKINDKITKNNYNLILPATLSTISTLSILDISEVVITNNDTILKFNENIELHRNYNYFKLVQNINNFHNEVSFNKGYYFDNYSIFFNNIYKNLFKMVLKSINTIDFTLNLIGFSDKNIAVVFNFNGIIFKISNTLFIKKLIQKNKIALYYESNIKFNLAN